MGDYYLSVSLTYLKELEISELTEGDITVYKRKHR